jgi:hypothetical protein
MHSFVTIKDIDREGDVLVTEAANNMGYVYVRVCHIKAIRDTAI